MNNDSTLRFSNRVANYAKYRPSYPGKVLDYLGHECHLDLQSVVADVGSGTGIFTRLLLDKGYQVYAVEPNDAMRCEAERHLKSCPGFYSVLCLTRF